MNNYDLPEETNSNSMPYA